MKKQSNVKLFQPLDVPTLVEAGALLREIGQYYDVIKVGLGLMNRVGQPAAVNLPKVFGRQVFADTKFYDIPNTVRDAAAGITSLGVDYFNVMAEGMRYMMSAAMEGADKQAREWGIKRPKVIAVTILTSQSFDDLARRGIVPVGTKEPETKKEKQEFITSIVMKLAEEAISAGVDCLLSSPIEAPSMIKKWPSVEVITPGIRNPDSPPDDQTRKMSPYEAAKAGITGMVIGRLIRKPPEGVTREEMAKKVRGQIDKALSEMKP